MNVVQNIFPVCVDKKLKRKPISTSLGGIALVIFRDAKGEVQILEDRCPHRGAPLSQGRVEGNCIVCPYHGWKFEGSGECKSVPGLCGFNPKTVHGVKRFPAVVRYGLVWTSLDGGEVPTIAELEKGNFTSFLLDSTVEVGMADAIENALDPLHTHYVHAGLIRSSGKRKEIKLQVITGEREIEVKSFDEEKQEGLIHRILSMGRKVTLSVGRFIAPQVFQLEYHTTKGDFVLITGFVQPLNEQCSKIYLLTAVRSKLPLFIFVPLARFFFGVAIRQDREILNLVAKHRKKTGEGRPYVSTEADMVGPAIKLLLEGKKLTPKTKEVTLYV